MNSLPAPGPTPADPRVAYFDALAPAWDRDGPDPAATRRRLGDLEGRLGLRPGLDLLEVGCGTGQITGWLAERVKPGRVFAMDFSPRMLALARARGVPAEFVLGDICRARAAVRKCDRVLCFHSFPHFRDPGAALRHIARHLKPGGHLIVLHLAGSAPLNAFHQSLAGPVRHDHLPPLTAWPALLEPVGLRMLAGEDREDLFFLKAEKGRARARSRRG